MQLYVLSLVHHTPAASAELLNDAVMRDGLADQFENTSPRAAILGWMNSQVNAERGLSGLRLKWDC